MGEEGGRMQVQITYCSNNLTYNCVSIHTNCLLHMHKLFTVYTQSAYTQMFTVYTQIVHCIHTNCLLYTHKLFTVYTQVQRKRHIGNDIVVIVFQV